MSLSQPFFLLITHPTSIAVVGATTIVGLPYAQAAIASSSVSTTILSILNVAGFGVNLGAVSVPGRLDGQQDEAMRGGEINPRENTPLISDPSTVYTRARNSSLVTPAGWAFTIWAPIYLGEAIYCASLFVPATGLASSVAPIVTAPFISANIFQSLWCASFRSESFNGTWTTLISPLMLAGTAYSLSMVNAVAAGNWFLVPLTMHFGWTTAATLVNLNSSLAALHEKEFLVTATGHASAVAATALGVGITLAHATPAYGFTVAWALAACADGVSRQQHSNPTAATVQKYLCWAGAGICAATSIKVLL